jgi:predicted dehydrogenase
VDDRSLDLFSVGEDGRVRTSLSLRGGLPAFTAQSANFVRAVRGEEPPRTPAAHGVQIMALLDGIYRSAAQGREVVLSAASS